MEDRLERFEAKINLSFNRLSSKIDSQQASIDYLTTLVERLTQQGSSKNSSLVAIDQSLLTESADHDMKERLDNLSNNQFTENQPLSELEKEVETGLNELKSWANSDANSEPQNETPTGSISASFIEAEPVPVNADDDLSFSLIDSSKPIENQAEQKNSIIRKRSIASVRSEVENIEKRSSSSMSFEYIDGDDESDVDSIKTATSLISGEVDITVVDCPEIRVEPIKTVEISSEQDSVKSEDDEKLQEALMRQSQSMKNLLVQLKSGFSRQSSTSEPLTDEDRRKRDEETQRQISQLAIEIDSQNTIKHSVNGDAQTPKNSRDHSVVTSGAPSTVGMESAENTGSFPPYRSFEEIPVYVPPQPTPISSSINFPMPSQVDNRSSIIRLIGQESGEEPEVSSGFGLQVDLDRDTRAMQIALETKPVESGPAPVEAPVQADRSIDFRPTNGIQTLREEFGAEYDVLSAAALRKMDYDASRAAKLIREKDLRTSYLVAKLRLEDLDCEVSEVTLAQLCVTYDNIHQVVSDYIEFEFNQDATVVNIEGADSNRPQTGFGNFVNFARNVGQSLFS